MDLAVLSADELRKFVEEKAPGLLDIEPEPEPAPPQPAPSKPKHVVLGILSHDWAIECRTMMCMMSALAACQKRNWGFDVILRDGDSMVARGRSFIASQFLENPKFKASQPTDLFFWDCDVTCKGEEFIRLLEHDIGPDGEPVGIVGGAYPFKRDEAGFPMRWGSRPPVITDPLWQVDSVTPGFMRITRRAIELVAGRTPWLEYYEHLAGKDQRTWMFFDNLHRRNGIFDEGYVFCEHWRLCGGKVWLDPHCNLSHIGKKIFSHGTFYEHFAKKGAEAERLAALHPEIPADQILKSVVTGEKLEGIDETNDQHSDPGAAGTAGPDDPADAAEHSPIDDDADDLGGRGRQGDGGTPVNDALRAGSVGKRKAKGRQPGRKVRSGANGGPRRHLSAGG